MEPSQELIGKKFGLLTVIKPIKKQSKTDKRWRTFYRCQCDCGNERTIGKDKLIKGNVVSCGCKKKSCGPQSATWKGHGDLPQKYVSNLKHHAKIRGIDFEISIEEMWDLFLLQDRKCALSGVLLHFKCRDSINDGTASLDRINSNKGYSADNIQWVHKDINWMKHKLSQPQFLNWIGKVYNNNTDYFNQTKDSLS